MKRLLFILLLLGPILGAAQDSTKVRFFVKGSSEFYIKVDGALMPLQHTQYLTPGEHQLEIWSPMHRTFSGSITVPPSDSISYYQELKKDPAYIDYLIATDRYKRQILLGRTAPLMASIAGGLLTPYFFFARKKWHQDLVKETFKADYFAGDAAGLENTERRYQAVNAMFYTSSGLIVGGLLTHYLLRNWVKNLDKPTYQQMNPFTLERFELGYHPVLRSPQIGLTLNF
jgi:hypothetical protein